eukprot:Amastigsp_a1616_1586.p2 type:complete len:338 gc:universal Amastigsp_a1616_1586:1034-21(-)
MLRLCVLVAALAFVPFAVAQLGVNCYPAYDPCGANVASQWATECRSPVCAGGKKQSPINVQVFGLTATAQPAPLTIEYDESAFVLSNRGAFFAWDVPSSAATLPIQVSGGPRLDKLNYRLRQFSSHTPSEHRINGVMYPAELQFYNQNTKGQIMGLAIMVVQGPRSAFLDELISSFWLTPSKTNSTDVIANPARAIAELGPDKSYYTYNGSLTVPPCSEVVTWLIFSTPLSAEPDQIDALNLGRSRRDLQPLNGRNIAFFSNTFFPPPPAPSNKTIPDNVVAFGVSPHPFAMGEAYTILIIMLLVLAAFVGACAYGYSQASPASIEDVIHAKDHASV